MRRRSCLPFLLITLCVLVLGGLFMGFLVPLVAQNTFGVPSSKLSVWQKFSYGWQLLSRTSDLTGPRDPNGAEQLFVIQPGDSVPGIASRLEQAGIISNANIFRIFLAWNGMDAYIQTGTFRLSPALSAQTIAGMLESASLTEVTFSILPGWRMEEIAASLPTSGLSITTEEFLDAASGSDISLDVIPLGSSAEGFLYPDVYILPRSTNADQLVAILLQDFASHLPGDFPDAYASLGLSVYQAVTLASIIEREAIQDEEMPMIASVLLNRLAIGMKLQTDPTVQYALGFNAAQDSWWTTPLSMADLQFDSPYNTYLYPGLPPGPISNPGEAALGAVARPAQSSFYYFQAKCDGSGYHNFAETLEQHEQNYCP